MSFALWGSGQLEMALTLSADMERPSGERQKPRYSVEVVWNSHFFRFSKEIMLVEALEDFTDMLLMQFNVFGVDKDVVYLDDYADIEHVGENAVNKSLESCGSIGQAERHDIPLEGAIPCAKRGLPFISISNADQVVHVAEIDFGVDLCLARRVKEVGDEREWIAVFL